MIFTHTSRHLSCGDAINGLITMAKTSSATSGVKNKSKCKCRLHAHSINCPPPSFGYCPRAPPVCHNSRLRCFRERRTPCERDAKFGLAMTGRANPRPPTAGRAVASVGSTGVTPASPVPSASLQPANSSALHSAATGQTQATPKPRQNRPKVPTGRARAPPPSTPKRADIPAQQNATGESVAGQKRSRPGSQRAEPDAKRHKPITGAAASAVKAANARNAAAAAAAATASSLALSAVAPRAGTVVGASDTVSAPPPPSPSSSRSRPRKPPPKPRGLDTTNAASVVLKAGTSHVSSNTVNSGTATANTAAAAIANAGTQTSAAAPVAGQSSSQTSMRRGARAPPPAKSQPSQTTPASHIVVDGVAMPGNIRVTTFGRRLFGQEIQCLMHAFGEVRYCARDVLEIVEDTVRERVRRIAISSAERSVEMATRAGTVPQMNKSKVVVTVPHIAHVLRHNPRTIYRLNADLKSARSATERNNNVGDTAVEASPAFSSWETANELAEFPDIEEVESVPSPFQHWTERVNLSSDIFLACTYRANYVIRNGMTKSQFTDFCACRGVSFVKQENKSRAPTVRGQPRIELFRNWLDLDGKDGLYIGDDALLALGYVASETVGIITQTALLFRHFDDVAKGLGDPRASQWSIGRHILAALGHGIVQGIMIYMTEGQGQLLKEEIERMDVSSQPGHARWRGYAKMSSPCLLPSHIKEAIRRTERAPDALWGFSSI